jgi:DNA polymerase-3 subunit beta
MKLSISKSALLNGLQTVQNVVGVRSTIPVLANTLINVDKEKIWLTTTDLDMTVRCSIPATVTKTGSTTLPVKRLVSIIRELPDAEIQIECDEKNTAQLTCGSSFFKIIGLAEDEFPPIPKPEEKFAYRMDQGLFKQMLKKVGYAASTDETRFVLNGVLLSFKGGKLAVVATDGRRLALVEQEIDFPADAEGDMILPSKAVSELLHVLADEGEMNIQRSQNQIMFAFGDILIISKLIDGTYPNYRQVIPAHCDERIAVEREGLLIALRRVSLLVSDKTSATRLTFGKNKLTIAVSTPDIGEARETLPIKYTGKEITVAFNAEFMMDPLKNLTQDEIFMELTDDMSPGVMKCDMPFLYVLMPMRVT